MTGDSKDLVVGGLTIGLRQGRISPGCLSFALDPTCLSRSVNLLDKDADIGYC